MRNKYSLQHLDVKPENLLIVSGYVKVADFGLVKDIDDTRASMMGGLTPIYASPEVFDDRPSQCSDQYSLAIVYQELLTDTLPFPGKTTAQLAAQHLQSRPRLTASTAGRQADHRSRALQGSDRAFRHGPCHGRRLAGGGTIGGRGQTGDRRRWRNDAAGHRRYASGTPRGARRPAARDLDADARRQLGSPGELAVRQYGHRDQC